MKSKSDGKYTCKVSSVITCIPKNHHPMQNHTIKTIGIMGCMAINKLKYFISDTLKKS